ncbi:MAG: threonine synthase [Thermodesulfovibrio sp.]|uniref:threonine synthase n=1 Tax=unclassified Thermodesulfovibrio TaxID=2645936 RepID=UPI000839E20F|nr:MULTISPECIES: threonine synthase [unclassified Thermodesulfovibrio]MDI1471865.1 threonine synthase [Thermodesulfovibrio sp. 1176]MDI6714936.1 threonine synthase [Thermodesulfovibrio sp.]ODA44809.1 Threonine synthase [Thermodesulfovibrio sp. N1]
MNAKSPWKGIIREYYEFFPVTEKTPIVTLLEGNTPLVKVNNLTNALNIDLELYLKFDGANPTGSFKDRGMTLAISKALEEGSRAVICASTGNTSASASAYAARAGIKAIVLIPEGKIATGKLVQAMIHGAVVIQIKGNFDQALNIVRAIVKEYPITLVNSINPYRIEGQKSAAFEVCDQLGQSPDYHVLPVGNAGNISAYWKGYKEYKEKGRISELPKMLGFQASGAAPIVLGRPVEKPETIATAIRIGNPASWATALQARDESGGKIDIVTDEEILKAYKMIASYEGIFCEPASAATVAGVIKLYNEGYFKKGSTVVCTLTGNGLKDPDTVFKVADEPRVLPADLDSVRAFVEKLL